MGNDTRKLHKDIHEEHDEFDEDHSDAFEKEAASGDRLPAKKASAPVVGLELFGDENSETPKNSPNDNTNNTGSKSSLPADVQANLARFAGKNPSQTDLVNGIAGLDPESAKRAGVDALLSKEGTSPAELSVALRHAQVLKGIEAFPKYQEKLEKLLHRGNETKTPEPERLQLLERIVKLSPDELKKSGVEFCLSQNEKASNIKLCLDQFKPVPKEAPKPVEARPLREALSKEKIGDLVEDAFSGAGKELRNYGWSETDVERAKSIAKKVLHDHLPGVEPIEVFVGGSQLAFQLNDGSVLKVQSNSNWNEEWGKRVWGDGSVCDCPLLPLNGDKTAPLKFNDGSDTWLAYRQPAADSEAIGERETKRFFKQVGESQVGDANHMVETVARQAGILEVEGKKRIAVYDYEAVDGEGDSQRTPKTPQQFRNTKTADAAEDAGQRERVSQSLYENIPDALKKNAPSGYSEDVRDALAKVIEEHRGKWSGEHQKQAEKLLKEYEAGDKKAIEHVNLMLNEAGINARDKAKGTAKAATEKTAQAEQADSQRGAERYSTAELKPTTAQQFAMETLSSADGLKYIKSIPMGELTTARIEEKMKTIDDEIALAKNKGQHDYAAELEKMKEEYGRKTNAT
ncbi:MAG: hypothetical protein K2X81_00660, partial [Candidatus Obscuribacterales bacterium]|nr:hypothetical protein [Candidatus Obscuribacterales bacterium]